MPIYQRLPEVLKKYEGFTITKDIIKKILKESEVGYVNVDEYYKREDD